MCCRSFQGLEISADILQLVGRQFDARHLRAGLEALRIGDPCSKRAPVARQQASRDRLATAYMRQVGSRATARCRAPDRVAEAAAARDINTLAVRDLARGVIG